MNKQVLAVIIGVIVVLVIGYFVWRIISAQFLSDNDNSEERSVASAEEIAEAISAISLPDDKQSLTGSSVSIDKNKVVSEISENIFWTSPLGGDKNTILINSSGTGASVGNVISFDGEVVSIKDYQDQSASWKLSLSDLAIIRDYPLMINASSLEVLE